MREPDPDWVKKLAAVIIGALVAYCVIYPGLVAVVTKHHVESAFSDKRDGSMAVNQGLALVVFGLMGLAALWWMAWGDHD